jgi:twinkle protein
LYITDSVLNLLTITDQIINSSAVVILTPQCLSSNQDVLTKLEKYNEIIFWQKDKNLSFELAKHLNINRCFMISSAQSAYESLFNNDDLSKLIKEKFHLKEKSIIKFNNLKHDILIELNDSKKYTGKQWLRFPHLNEILKGHRQGELTIFTGPTGSGKTTFLSEYSLDLAQQGLTTMWGSFEIRNHRLAKIMMTQYARLNLRKNILLFDSIEKKFQQLPIYFMDFHGEQTVKNVIDTMSKSVILYDVKHIIIDNLQFMLGCQFNNSIERFYLQDIMINLFRRFATNFNCHITLVIHPRKESNDEPLKTASIFGTAKASQEADNIIILQDEQLIKNDKLVSNKYIEITKNRFDGELGKFNIKFEKEILSFMPTTQLTNQKRNKEEKNNNFILDLSLNEIKI